MVDDAFDWGGVPKPDVPLDRTVVYEANVRTLTAANPDVPEHLRGSTPASRTRAPSHLRSSA